MLLFVVLSVVYAVMQFYRQKPHFLLRIKATTCFYWDRLYHRMRNFIIDHWNKIKVLEENIFLETYYMFWSKRDITSYEMYSQRNKSDALARIWPSRTAPMTSMGKWPLCGRDVRLLSGWMMPPSWRIPQHGWDYAPSNPREKRHTGLNVKCQLSSLDLNQNWNVSTITINKTQQYQMS
jgi:hypothetical protein